MARPPAAPPDPRLVAEVLAEAGERVNGEVLVEPLPLGTSRDSWLVTARDRRYVLKRDPLHERSPQTSRQREYEAALAARGAGVPVPQPICYEPAGGRFGSAGLVAAFVEGTSSPRQIQALDAHGPARTGLVRDIGRAAGMLARAAIPATWEEPKDPLDQVLEEIRFGLDFIAADRPVLAAAFRWAELNRPATIRPVLLHGDFRVGNLMVADAGLTAVIDWEFTSVGSAGQDFGWFCMRPWRFDAETMHAGGLGSLGELLDGYAATAPEPLDPAQVRYFEVIGQLRWGLYCLLQGWSYREGGHASLERLATSRRTDEVEWDLLDVLEDVG